jgi:hypothetical protein
MDVTMRFVMGSMASLDKYFAVEKVFATVSPCYDALRWKEENMIQDTGIDLYFHYIHVSALGGFNFNAASARAIHPTC